MPEPMLKLSAVAKVFHTDEVETHALSNVYLEVMKGEFVSINGPSGSGKSTLLAILGLLAREWRAPRRCAPVTRSTCRVGKGSPHHLRAHLARGVTIAAARHARCSSRPRRHPATKGDD